MLQPLPGGDVTTGVEHAQPRLGHDPASARPFAHGRPHHEHTVGFYEDDDFLVETVVDFLAPALDAGDTAIAIATADHRSRFEEAFADRVGGSDVGPPSGLVSIDAAQVLARFMVDGVPDAARFDAAMTAIIGDAATRGRPVRIYGEMVAVLWEQGDVAAALAVEDLWNGLAESRSFELLCGYPMSAFEQGETTSTLRDVCERHGRVIPSESYSTLSDPDDRLRAVALLQGEAAAASRERKALQREQAELEAAMSRLRELERLRKEFVAMLVHDIRGPATVIAATLEVLQDGWSDLDQGSIKQLLEGAAGNAHRIERLAADMLTLSRIESGSFAYHLDAVALDRLVDRAVSEAAAFTGRVIRVDVAAQPLPDALADEERQLQILGNLLSNAVKFSPDDSEVVVSLASSGDELTVSIRDRGAGIDPDDQATLFQPFTRVRSEGTRIEGFGLGLYTAKVLVEGQGGRIWVDSTPGAGSTFSYTVPTARPH